MQERQSIVGGDGGKGSRLNNVVAVDVRMVKTKPIGLRLGLKDEDQVVVVGYADGFEGLMSKILIGDVISHINGAGVHSIGESAALIGKIPNGDTLTLTLIRDDTQTLAFIEEELTALRGSVHTVKVVAAELQAKLDFALRMVGAAKDLKAQEEEDAPALAAPPGGGGGPGGLHLAGLRGPASSAAGGDLHHGGAGGRSGGGDGGGGGGGVGGPGAAADASWNAHLGEAAAGALPVPAGPPPRRRRKRRKSVLASAQHVPNRIAMKPAGGDWGAGGGSSLGGNPWMQQMAKMAQQAGQTGTGAQQAFLQQMQQAQQMAAAGMNPMASANPMMAAAMAAGGMGTGGMGGMFNPMAAMFNPMMAMGGDGLDDSDDDSEEETSGVEENDEDPPARPSFGPPGGLGAGGHAQAQGMMPGAGAGGQRGPYHRGGAAPGAGAGGTPGGTYAQLPATAGLDSGQTATSAMGMMMPLNGSEGESKPPSSRPKPTDGIGSLVSALRRVPSAVNIGAAHDALPAAAPPPTPGAAPAEGGQRLPGGMAALPPFPARFPGGGGGGNGPPGGGGGGAPLGAAAPAGGSLAAAIGEDYLKSKTAPPAPSPRRAPAVAAPPPPPPGAAVPPPGGGDGGSGQRPGPGAPGAGGGRGAGGAHGVGGGLPPHNKKLRLDQPLLRMQQTPATKASPPIKTSLRVGGSGSSPKTVGLIDSSSSKKGQTVSPHANL